jgi:hypothetical protein
MRVSYIATSAEMSMRELLRNRLILVLAALVPLLSFGVAVVSTQDRPVAVRLARAPTAELLMVSERSQAILFLGIAAVGLMGAFFGANLVQRRVEVNRRLVLCGYRTSELVMAKLGVLFVIIVASALYTLALLLLLLDVERPLGVLVGFGLAAFVYGAYGLCVGSIFRRDLEAVFAILLLINIDAGWLQNPIYYLHTRSPWLVESLPGHLPAQTALLAALTSHPILETGAMAVLYGTGFLMIALLVYGLRMQVAR